MPLTQLFVDNRWGGAHGIGRYSSEVIPRINLDWEPLGLTSRPATIRDFLTPRSAAKQPLVYSPGFNAGLGNSNQILTVHDLIHLHYGNSRYRWYYDSILRSAIRRSGVAFTVSEASKSAITEWLNDLNVEVINTGNGISAAFQCTSPPATSPSPSFLLYVGNNKPHKNAELIFAILRAATEKRLITVGLNLDIGSRLAANYGVSDRVRILNNVTDSQLARLYRDAQATLLPSKLEGFGLPAAESIASGTPVIYWRGCESVREIVGELGLQMQSATDIEEWVAAVNSPMRRIESHERLAAIETYSWKSVGEKVMRGIEKARSGE